MRLNRRSAVKGLVGMVSASPLVAAAGGAQIPAPPEDGPVLEPACVMDFEPLAKGKLDKLAYDYLAGGSEDEASVRDNRAAFDRIIIRPRVLVDVHKIDLSTELFDLKLEYPILLDP